MAEGKLRDTDFVTLQEQNEEAAEEKRRRKAELLEARERDRKRREFAIILVVVLVIAFVTILAVIISKESAARKQEQEREVARESDHRPEDLTLKPEKQESEKVVVESTPDNEETPADATGEEPGGESTAAPADETPDDNAEPGFADAEELRSIEKPSWVDEALLSISEYSRPGFALTEANNIVIHYVGNPGTTAMGNRDYFESLADPQQNPGGHGASSHYVVGLQGEIVQCIPLYEVAFANYPRNYDTISIEVCHPDAGGQFNNDTYWALVRLAAYLLEETGMRPDQLIRHYDVSGKLCPIYYVEHPEAWTQFRHAVGEYMKEHPDIRTELP